MSERILFVEDHDETRNVVAKLLRRKGYEVMCVSSGGEALKLATEVRFDLVIMDHGLPDGHGCLFMKVLRSVYSLSGIALTGNAYLLDKRMSHEAGFEHHFTKPVNFGELASAITACLEAKKLHATSAPSTRRLFDDRGSEGER